MFSLTPRLANRQAYKKAAFLCQGVFLSSEHRFARASPSLLHAFDHLPPPPMPMPPTTRQQTAELEAAARTNAEQASNSNNPSLQGNTATNVLNNMANDLPSNDNTAAANDTSQQAQAVNAPTGSQGTITISQDVLINLLASSTRWPPS
jgi:hypothetical protein